MVRSLNKRHDLYLIASQFCCVHRDPGESHFNRTVSTLDLLRATLLCTLHLPSHPSCRRNGAYMYMCVYTYVRTYVCVCVCMYVCVCVCVCESLMWCTYCRCFTRHFKCHFLQIELNNWFLHKLHQSINVSLIAVSVEQLIELLLTRCWLLPILPITLHRHPCHTWKVELF